MDASGVRYPFAVKLEKCEHANEGVKVMTTYPGSFSVRKVFHDIHGDDFDLKKYSVHAKASSGKEEFELDWSLTVGDLVSSFQVKNIRFNCVPTHDHVRDDDEEATPAAPERANAFHLLMSTTRARCLPPKKTSSSGVSSGLNRKDELFNSILDQLRDKGVDFAATIANSEGGYFIQVLTNALWYVTNDHMTINDASARHADVLPIPPTFDNFTGYNEMKRKKMKASPLQRTSLVSQAEALFSLLNKPYIKSTAALCAYGEEVQALGECFSAYAKFLSQQLQTVSANHLKHDPVRTVDEHTTVEAKTSSPSGVKKQYLLLDAAIKEAGLSHPIIFNEDVHLSEPFCSNMARHRFWENIELSVPIDILRFNTGGPLLTTIAVSQVEPTRNESEKLTQAARMLAKLRPRLQEVHTREMKKAFRLKVNNITSIQPSVVDFIFAQLSFDRSAASNPEMQHRLRMMFLGHEGLMADMRHLNPGRPSGHFDVFFAKLIAHCETITAADDRRHGEAHMSEWISLRDMIEKVAAECPDGTPIPSRSLVRLQFMPTNPYTHAAQSFTSKVPIQRKIQRRQLRSHHQDDHYCAAQFRYLKKKSIELGDEQVLFCCDDKAKVKLGEPDTPISTGVRGRESLAPTNTTLVALDHDMAKATVTPSVVLRVQQKPNATADDSFVRGKVTTTVNDSVFQSSSPFRHAAMLLKVMEAERPVPRVLLKYTDGGTDQRNTLESVKCATICLFQELSLDMAISVRCAPGQSYQNPAERVMSILNYGLQNCATERERQDEDTERILKRCNSSANIREMAKKHEGLKEKWLQSVQPVQEAIANRFLRLKLKDEPIRHNSPVSDEEIELLQRHLKSLFPTLNLGKLQKQHTQKCREYVDWKERHCRETQYTFQIRKCGDDACCPRPPNTADLTWLPEPVLDATGEHYLQYEEVKMTDTSEKDRPSNQKPKSAAKSTKLLATPSPQPSTSTDPPGSTPPATSRFLSAQTARATAVCVECLKPRVVYGNRQMNQRQEVLLAVSLSEHEYSCGSHIFPPNSSTLMSSITVREHLTCAHPIEIAYYGADIGRKDLCCHCGATDAFVDQVLKQRFKTVLPVCESCVKEGKLAITQRPFGKQK